MGLIYLRSGLRRFGQTPARLGESCPGSAGPVVTAAPRADESQDFPAPGSPTMPVSRPSGKRPGHSQLTSSRRRGRLPPDHLQRRPPARGDRLPHLAHRLAGLRRTLWCRSIQARKCLAFL